MSIEIAPGIKVQRDVLEAIIDRGIDALNRADGECDGESDEEYGDGPEPWVPQDCR